MKHSFTYKLLSVIVSLLVLFSSLSFTIEKHFCEGEMHSSIFSNSEELCIEGSPKCHNEEAESSCCSSNVKESKCCLNTSEFVEGIAVEQQAQIEQSIRLFPVFFLVSDYFSVSSILKTVRFFTEEFVIPPPKTHDLGILFQVFRI